MEITRVNISLCDDHRIKAYATITLDDCFIIHGLRLTHSKKGYFLFMPGRKRAYGTYVDIVHALNNETRQMIREKVVEEYERIIKESVKVTGAKIKATESTLSRRISPVH